MALPLGGKKRGLTAKLLVDEFGMKRLGLNEATVKAVLDELRSAIPSWREIISRSFLSDGMKGKYRELLGERGKRLWLGGGGG